MQELLVSKLGYLGNTEVARQEGMLPMPSQGR